MMQPRQIDLMGKKYVWFAMSGLIILIGMISLATRGLNLSIDFTSGSRLVTSFSGEASVDGVRDVVSGLGYGDAVVQTVGDNSYQISLPALSTEQENEVVAGLDSSFGVSEKSWKSVGPTFGRQVLRAMIE
ncbi:MAG: hypothetical protein AAB281_07295, partial [Actinomycetota bacterium]